MRHRQYLLLGLLTALAAGAGEGATRAKASNMVRQAMATSDVSLARQWFATLPERTMRDRVAGRLAVDLLSKGMPGARDFALSLPEGPARADALRAVSVEITDPQDAAAFFNSLPATETRDLDRYSEAMSRWFRLDPSAAAVFVQAHAAASPKEIRLAQ